MTVDQALQKLDTDLHAGDVKVRREAVNFAAKLLKQRACSEECRQRIVAVLEAAAARDLPTVRDAAQNVLENLQAGFDPTWGPADRKRMIPVPCTCGHINYFDPRTVCTDSTPLYRTPVRGSQGEQLDEIAERCKKCNRPLKFRVNCEGY